MDRGVFVSRAEAERTTLAEALKRYEREISVGKAHPAQDYQRIRHWLRQPLAHHFLANLRGADFAKYRDDRLAIGRAANTVRLELALVSHLFEIARNPTFSLPDHWTRARGETGSVEESGGERLAAPH